MPKYTRIRLKEREEIYRLKQLGKQNIEIAEIIGKHKSSIGRELRRNNVKKLGYLPDRADSMTKKRKCRDPKISRSAALLDYISDNLAAGWSPELISGRLKEIEKPDFYACKETIYQYIYRTKTLCKHLTRKRYSRVERGQRKRKSNIVNMVRISQRPKEISTRKTVGHWEGDLVIFTNLRSSNVATIVERKTRYSLLIHNDNKYTETVMGNIADKMSKLDNKVLKSVTFDRGSEFCQHEKLHEYQIDTYFCAPASPWQKGGNESEVTSNETCFNLELPKLRQNFNGRLRRWLPKSFDHTKLSQDLLDEIQNKMNNTPRKCLGYRTPNEAMNEEIMKSGCAAK